MIEIDEILREKAINFVVNLIDMKITRKTGLCMLLFNRQKLPALATLFANLSRDETQD